VNPVTVASSTGYAGPHCSGKKGAGLQLNSLEHKDCKCLTSGAHGSCLEHVQE